MFRTILIVTVASVAAISNAAVSVVPNANAAVEANAFFNIASTTTTRVYQFVINSNQLGAHTGEFLNGLTWRLNGGGRTFGGASFSSFDIYLGPGVSPAASGSVFAANYSGTRVQVRSGGLTFAAGTFTGGSFPNAFGPVISFSHYLYTGGHLIIEMRYSTISPTGPFFDAADLNAAGYGTDYKAWWSIPSTATGSIPAHFMVTQLSSSPVPEPASMIALGLGAAALLRRRRKKA